MTNKEVKEETPEVKELTEHEIEMKIWLIPEEENIQGVCEDVAKWAKSRCDEYWKSVIEQKDQEISELNKIIETYISLVDDAAKEINQLENENKDLKFNFVDIFFDKIRFEEENKKLKEKRISTTCKQ